MEEIQIGIVTYTQNEDGTWTRVVDETAKQTIIDKLNKETE